MADVKKINGYAIKDEIARQIANIVTNDNGDNWSQIWGK